MAVLQSHCMLIYRARGLRQKHTLVGLGSWLLFVVISIPIALKSLDMGNKISFFYFRHTQDVSKIINLCKKSHLPERGKRICGPLVFLNTDLWFTLLHILYPTPNAQDVKNSMRKKCYPQNVSI